MKVLTLASSPRALEDAVSKSIEILKRGGIIVAPTETAYGLVTNAKDKSALHKLFKLKQRSMDKPSAIFIESADNLKDYMIEIEAQRMKKIKLLWPGPITFVLKSGLPAWEGVLSKEGKIGFRCSSHKFISTLFKKYRRPLTATSANISGKIPTSIDEIKTIFSEYIELFIVDPVLNFNSLPSTVVELTDNNLKILREGVVQSELIIETFRSDK